MTCAPAAGRASARRRIVRAPAPVRAAAPSRRRRCSSWRRDGPSPLAPPPGDAGGPLASPWSCPAFRRGSGGHTTIANLVRGLEARGHGCSVWIDDDEGRHAGDVDVDALFGVLRPVRRACPPRARTAWRGADVAVATGWQTVHRILRLPGAGARAYLVQDHEPEFYATSAERTVGRGRRTGSGLHCICAGPWLAELVRERYGASATSFDLGVDHDAYRPTGGTRARRPRRSFYARAVTPRRAVPLGLLALAELHRRRPGVEIALFGETRRSRRASRTPTSACSSRPRSPALRAGRRSGSCSR